MRNLFFAFILFGAAGCSDCEIESEDNHLPINLDFPRTFTIEGDAAGLISADSAHPERTISCICELNVELDSTKMRAGDTLIIHGFAGGMFLRKVLNPDESGFALQPDVFSEVIVKIYPPDSILFIFPPNINDITPFYREVAFLRGSIGEHNWGKGEWNCAPFNVDHGNGETDFEGIGTGLWEVDD